MRPLMPGGLPHWPNNQKMACSFMRHLCWWLNPNGAAEAAYLASLADKLGLAADLVAHLHAKAATLQAA